MHELQSWRHSGLAAEGNPGHYIDLLMYIRSHTMEATQDYYDLFLKHERSEMLMQGCEIALEQVQPY